MCLWSGRPSTWEVTRKPGGEVASPAKLSLQLLLSWSGGRWSRPDMISDFPQKEGKELAATVRQMNFGWSPKAGLWLQIRVRVLVRV